MKNNSFKDLIYKVFYSGNPMLLYIGINTVLFLLIVILEFLSKQAGSNWSVLVESWLGVPASISALPIRFYTIFTYMFYNTGFLNFLFNMLWLYWFGNIFMNFLKARQFHFVFLVGGITAALFYIAGSAFLPTLAGRYGIGYLFNSSSAVMAIIVATATLVPNYSIQLMLFGQVKIKYLVLIYIALDIFGVATANAGDAFAHLGAIIFGFVFIKQLQNGKDWSKIFEPKPKLRVVKNDQPINKSTSTNVPQNEIDAILDKISTSGYDKLTAIEKQKLFKASNN